MMSWVRTQFGSCDSNLWEDFIRTNWFIKILAAISENAYENLCVERNDVRRKQIEWRMDFTNGLRQRKKWKTKRCVVLRTIQESIIACDFIQHPYHGDIVKRVRTSSLNFYLPFSIFFCTFSYFLLLINNFKSLETFFCNIHLLA